MSDSKEFHKKNALVFPGVVIGRKEFSYKTVEQLSSGLTKREYFAGLVMQGVFSMEKNMDMVVKEAQITGSIDKAVLGQVQIAVIIADALIKELSKNGPTD